MRTRGVVLPLQSGVELVTCNMAVDVEGGMSPLVHVDAFHMQ